MKQLTEVLTAALMVAVLLAGCSGDDKEEEIVPVHAYKVTEENIIGVWKNGDHWVSFAEDGFMSAYLDVNSIAEGNYIIDGDTILAESSFLYTSTTFIVNSLSEQSVSLTISYYDLDKGKEKTITNTYTRATDMPTSKANGLIGKSFSYKTEVKFYDYNQRKTVSMSGTSTSTVTNHFIIDRRLVTDDGQHSDGSIDYYVFLSPTLYYLESGIGYNRSAEIINKRTLTFDANGTIHVAE